MAATLLSIPAGRCNRRGETKWVDPTPEKGVIEIKFEDDLLHFWWRNRQNNIVEDELVIFPGEATFEKVTQDPSGKTHVLKFSSSDQKYFFWYQRGSRDNDPRATADINGLLQDPSYQLGSAPVVQPPAAPSGGVLATPANPNEGTRPWPPTPGAPLLSHPEPGPPGTGPVPVTPSPMPAGTSQAGPSGLSAPGESNESANAGENIARMLAEWAQQGGIGAVDDDARLTDVLSPGNISTLLTSNPSLSSTLTPLLPPGLDLPSNPSPEDLIPILSAPQFTDAIGSLDNALRSGGLPGGMMRELGLPESAGTGVKAFLDALKALKKNEGGDDKMETD